MVGCKKGSFCAARNAAYGNDRGSDPPRQASRTPIRTPLLRYTSNQRIKINTNYLSK